MDYSLQHADTKHLSPSQLVDDTMLKTDIWILHKDDYNKKTPHRQNSTCLQNLHMQEKICIAFVSLYYNLNNRGYNDDKFVLS